MSAIYRPLNECIDNVINLGGFDDSFISHVPRDIIIDRVRRGYRKFVIQGITAEVEALRLDVSSANTVILPDNYIKYFRISKITDYGKLVPIKVDDALLIANSYLKDHNGEILVNEEGVKLTVSGDSDIDRTKTVYSFDYTQVHNTLHYDNYEYCNEQNINPTFYRGVTAKVDRVKNLIQLQGEKLDTIVLEYAYNPLKNLKNLDRLSVKESFADALEKWAYQDLIGPMRSVSPGEKERARIDYERVLLESKISALAPSLNDIVAAVHMI